MKKRRQYLDRGGGEKREVAGERKITARPRQRLKKSLRWGGIGGRRAHTNTNQGSMVIVFKLRARVEIATGTGIDIGFSGLTSRKEERDNVGLLKEAESSRPLKVETNGVPYNCERGVLGVGGGGGTPFRYNSGGKE